MSNTVTFNIEGVGAFEFRSQLSHLEETKLEMLVDKFLDYRLDEIRNDSFQYQEKAINNILNEKFEGKQIGDLSKKEKDQLDELYRADNSKEAVIAKKAFWQIHLIESTFRLDLLKVKVPTGFDFFAIKDDKDGIFLRIMTQLNKLTGIFGQKKS